jgi:hypothetical protein
MFCGSDITDFRKVTPALKMLALDHCGEAAGMGEDGRTFGDQRCGARKERGGDQIALPRDPAGISHHIDHVPRPSVERDLHGVGDAGGIAPVDVDHPLRLARRARGIDEEHRVFGVYRQRLGGGPDGADELSVG